MTLRRTAAATALALAMVAPGVAGASPIVTAALERASFLGESFNCRVVNTGTGTADVQIQLVGTVGQQVKAKETSIVPGGTGSVVHAGLDTHPIVYCRVTGISKRRAQVALSVLDLNHTVKAVVTAP